MHRQFSAQHHGRSAGVDHRSRTIQGFSAGSRPTGVVNPLAVEQIAGTGYTLAKLRSKSWDEFGAPDAQHMDFVITVCDSAELARIGDA